MVGRCVRCRHPTWFVVSLHKVSDVPAIAAAARLSTHADRSICPRIHGDSGRRRPGTDPHRLRERTSWRDTGSHLKRSGLSVNTLPTMLCGCWLETRRKRVGPEIPLLSFRSNFKMLSADNQTAFYLCTPSRTPAATREEVKGHPNYIIWEDGRMDGHLARRNVEDSLLSLPWFERSLWPLRSRTSPPDIPAPWKPA